MRQSLAIILLLTLKITCGQVRDVIYRGQKFPFEICYITIADTTAEIEFFYEKGGQIFGHRLAEKLFETKTGFKTKNDSISVIRADKYLVVKSKSHSGKIKLYQTTQQLINIYELRRRNSVFKHYQDSIKMGR